MELANMLRVIQLRTQGRSTITKAGHKHGDADMDDYAEHPLFQRFVRPCCAEFIGTMFYVIFSML
jgi:hypothetical protein